jgi:glycosyltransferase involved in cell wall biosynthesis
MLTKMDKATPLVSVIIPTYNSAGFIAQAVQGVLAQTYRCYEVIVIDDGSTDETQEVLRQFGGQIRYHRQENRGVSAARNEGIKIAQGEYVCLLDADDIWAPDKLKVQVDFMTAHRTLGLAFADAEECEERKVLMPSILATSTFYSDIVSQIPLRDAFGKLLMANFIPTSSVMIKRDCFSKTGLFDEDLQVAEDRDMWLRVAADFEMGCLPMKVATKRSHGANISTRTELTHQSRLRVWDKARRRFPALAPAAVYHKLLAVTHLELGYIFLARGDGRKARRAGIASLVNAVRYVVGARSRFPYRWLLSLSLIPLSLVPWPFVRWLWQARNTGRAAYAQR